MSNLFLKFVFKERTKKTTKIGILFSLRSLVRILRRKKIIFTFLEVILSVDVFFVCVNVLIQIHKQSNEINKNKKVGEGLPGFRKGFTFFLPKKNPEILSGKPRYEDFSYEKI